MIILLFNLSTYLNLLVYWFTSLLSLLTSLFQPEADPPLAETFINNRQKRQINIAVNLYGTWVLD